jgi:hypothetical protein
MVARALEAAEKAAPHDRSLRSRLGKQLILGNADSEPRPEGAIFMSFSAACLACGVGFSRRALVFP